MVTYALHGRSHTAHCFVRIPWPTATDRCTAARKAAVKKREGTKKKARGEGKEEQPSRSLSRDTASLVSRSELIPEAKEKSVTAFRLRDRRSEVPAWSDHNRLNLLDAAFCPFERMTGSVVASSAFDEAL